jgi:hypothetical protein
VENFVSLTKTLTAEDFGRPFAELSAPKQALVERRFPPAPDAHSGNPRRPTTERAVPAWDALSVEHRWAHAESSDFQRDPANEGLLEKLSALQAAITADIEEAKGDVDQLALGSQSEWARKLDPIKRGEMRARCEDRLGALKAQERELLDTKAAELSSVVERLIELRRLREAGGPTAPAATIAPAEINRSEGKQAQASQPIVALKDDVTSVNNDASSIVKKNRGRKPGDGPYVESDKALEPRMQAFRDEGVRFTNAVQALISEGAVEGLSEDAILKRLRPRFRSLWN